MSRGMGHLPEMVKISPACVGHLKTFYNRFVEKVQGRLACKGFFGETTSCLIRRLKYVPPVSNSLDPDQAQHLILPDLGPNCLKSRLCKYMFTSIVPDMGED